MEFAYSILDDLLLESQREAHRRNHEFATKWHLALVLQRAGRQEGKDILRSYQEEVEKELASFQTIPPSSALPGPSFQLGMFLCQCEAAGIMRLETIANSLEKLGTSDTACYLPPPETGPTEIVGKLAYDKFDHVEVISNIQTRVQGQDHAVVPVVEHLKLTTQQMDSRPERPDGVFLFAGPTGTGKTALALELSQQVFGDQEVIRYDMSEYSQEHTVARMLGAPPGYVGSDSSDNWLTSRINKSPRSLLLLDEIEKAHPSILTAFLQVFDAGKLTDAMGNEASFSNVVICMTTNLGSDVFTEDAAESDQDEQTKKVLQAVASQLPPEMINRLDQQIVFHPLSEETVRIIANDNIIDAFVGLAAHGRMISIGEGVFDQIVREGYSYQHGARHVLRAVDNNIRKPAALVPPGHYRVVIEDGEIGIVEA